MNTRQPKEMKKAKARARLIKIYWSEIGHTMLYLVRIEIKEQKTNHNQELEIIFKWQKYFKHWGKELNWYRNKYVTTNVGWLNIGLYKAEKKILIESN
jgi:hypothetical protein